MAFNSPPQRQFPDRAILLSHFIRQIESQHIRTVTQEPTMLHFDSRTGGLAEFAWPVDPVTEERILPNQLEAHRRSHEFLGPSCLCAFLEGKGYTEAEIGIVEIGSADGEAKKAVLDGEYVAICAKRRCGFFLCLERFYPLPDLMEEAHDLRAKPLALDRLVHISDIGKSYRRGDGLFQIMPDVIVRNHAHGLRCVHPEESKAVKAKTIADLMVGVSETAFWDIFVQCLECRQVQFREHYALNHRCSQNHPNPQEIDSSRHHPYRRFPRHRTQHKAGFHAHMSRMIGDTPAPTRMRGMPSRTRRCTHSESDSVGDEYSSSDALTEISSAYCDSPTPKGEVELGEAPLSDGPLPTISQLLSLSPRRDVQHTSPSERSTDEGPSADSETEDDQLAQNDGTDDLFWTEDGYGAGVKTPCSGSGSGSANSDDDEANIASSPTAERASDAASLDGMATGMVRTSDMERWPSPYDTVYEAITKINGPQ